MFSQEEVVVAAVCTIILSSIKKRNFGFILASSVNKLLIKQIC
jgi:hypothetical protein